MLYSEAGKLGNKPIEVYYVAPEPEKYGYASFTNKIEAIKYRDDMNRS